MSAQHVTQAQTDALERVLVGLTEQHALLIELGAHHREALREADAPRLAHIAGQRDAVNQQIVRLDRERAQIVDDIARALGMQGQGVTVRAIAAAIGGPASKKISALALSLRELIERCRREQSVLRDATATVAGHLGGILSQVSRACSASQTYTNRGQMAPGSAMPAAMDIRH